MVEVDGLLKQAEMLVRGRWGQYGKKVSGLLEGLGY